MGLNERVARIRDDAITRGVPTVPESLQSVTKSRIADVLRALDLETIDRVDAVFALLDYVDDADGERITDEDRDRLREAGLDLGLGDAMPDVLLWNRETNELWVIEAVTSDGEVDEQKVRRMSELADRHGKEGVFFTTAYPTWKLAAQRQGKHKNVAPATYVWIREDGSKHYRAESFRV